MQLKKRLMSISVDKDLSDAELSIEELMVAT